MTTLAWVTVAEQLRREIQARRIGPNGELDTEAELWPAIWHEPNHRPTSPG